MTGLVAGSAIEKEQAREKLIDDLKGCPRIGVMENEEDPDDGLCHLSNSKPIITEESVDQQNLTTTSRLQSFFSGEAPISTITKQLPSTITTLSIPTIFGTSSSSSSILNTSSASTASSSASSSSSSSLCSQTVSVTATKPTKKWRKRTKRELQLEVERLELEKREWFQFSPPTALVSSLSALASLDKRNTDTPSTSLGSTGGVGTKTLELLTETVHFLTKMIYREQLDENQKQKSKPVLQPSQRARVPSQRKRPQLVSPALFSTPNQPNTPTLNTSNQVNTLNLLNQVDNQLNQLNPVNLAIPLTLQPPQQLKKTEPLLHPTSMTQSNIENINAVAAEHAKENKSKNPKSKRKNDHIQLVAKEEELSHKLQQKKNHPFLEQQKNPVDDVVNSVVCCFACPVNLNDQQVHQLSQQVFFKENEEPGFLIDMLCERPEIF